jgi:hypothetical protein
MMAYKFLKAGAVGHVSGFAWPRPEGDAPGPWVESTPPVRQCASGVHVCRAPDLPYWISDELWAIEVEGPIVEGLNMLVARRGRLCYPFPGWTRAGRNRFVEACRDRAAARVGDAPPERRKHADAFMGHMDTYLRLEWTPLGALCAALAIASTSEGGGERPEPTKAAYRRERQWQARWLVDELHLEL